MSSTERISQIRDHLSPSDTPLPMEAMPGPWKTAHPKYGNSMEIADYFFRGKLPELFQRWKNEHGNIFMLTNYPLSTKTLENEVVVADVKEANRLLKLNPPKHPAYQDLRLLGKGVLSQHDQREWARHRELLKPIFSVKALKKLVPVMDSGAAELLNFIGNQADKKESFDFHDYVSNLAFLMIGHSALGEETQFLKDRGESLREAFDTVLNKGFTGEDISIDQDFKEADGVLKTFAKDVFERFNHTKSAPHKSGDISQCPFHDQLKSHHASFQRSADEQPSAIEVILGHDQEGKPNFDHRQREDQLSTFMFAGHETTANTISWIMLELARHPAIQDKLRQDINQTMEQLRKEKGTTNLEFSDLFKFQYLTLVINETLRMWPVVAQGTTRILDEDTVVGGYLVKKGTAIQFPIFLIHRDPMIWEKADEFIPERKVINDAFMPFSRAPRDCLGRNLAMLEIRTFLIAIIPKFRFTLAEPDAPITGFEAGTMRPENGAWLLAERII